MVRAPYCPDSPGERTPRCALAECPYSWWCCWPVLAAPAVQTQSKITPPQFTVGGKTYTAGDDYFLANYTQLQEYLARVDKESDRIQVVEIGKTAEGRPMLMAIVTSPENHKNLARYKDIANRLARAEGLSDEEARKLAAAGKAVVWIDSGLHGTEVINGQGMFTFLHQMASQNDAETLRILNDVITLVVNVNPDGMELVSNWYMRQADEKQRSTSGIPVLYEKYAGHDNNRDSYMNNLPETEVTSRQMYIEWNPQIMYNQHQTGPAGTVIFVPPFRDPVQLQLRPAGADGHRPGLDGHPQPLRHRGQGRGDDAVRGQLLDVVQRRIAHDDGLPQHGGHPHRDHRQPDAGRGEPRPRQPAAAPGPPAADPAADGVAAAPVHRLRHLGEPGHSGRRLEAPRGLPLPHLQDGPELDRARQP